jgi:threonine dehydratase
MPSIDISLGNIEKAAGVIDPVFRDSPQYCDDQLSAALGRKVLVKVETANPVRCFKGRGADFKFSSLDKG